MITITTRKYIIKSNGEVNYSKSIINEYICSDGVNVTMDDIANDKANNDLSLYTPIEIIDVCES